MRTGHRLVATVAAALVAAATLVGCGSTSTATLPAEAISAAESAASAAGDAGGVPGTPEMTALCDQMVAEGMSPDDATALAAQSGYIARVGMVDGEAMALTMDFREDRFTFEVESDVVVGCTYG
jgi:hypothetical protein